MSTDADIEQEIQSKGANQAPRITPADIEANIDSWWYFTAAEGAEGAAVAGTPYSEQPPVSASSPLRLLTFCVLVLRNGFTVTGESACASPENFNEEIGRRIARESAMQKVWPLMGYELRSRLASRALQGCSSGTDGGQPVVAGMLPHQQRVVAEKAEVDDRLNKLLAFTSTPIYAGLPQEERNRLSEQTSYMQAYSNVLGERIAAFS